MNERHKIVGIKYKTENFEHLGKKNPLFDKTDKELISLGIEEDIYEYTYDFKNVTLEAEPENEHDPNAVKVLLDGVHVGYIKKGSCSHVKNLMKENKQFSLNKFRYGSYKQIILDSDNDGYIEKGFDDGFCDIYIAEEPAEQKKELHIEKSEAFKKHTSASKPIMIAAYIAIAFVVIYLLLN